MKYLVVLCLLFLNFPQMFAQQEYFIYIQTDNNQPFYIRTRGNVYSSSANGFLILSKLPDSSTSLTIGFARNLFPEQQFNIPANHKDAGYLLKNLADKGWGLANLQTQAVLMSSSPVEEKKKSEITGSRRTDAFSQLLANAVNDTAVLYTVARPPKPSLAIAAANKTKDSLAFIKQEILRKDSLAVAEKLLAKKDSSIVIKSPPVKPQTLTKSKAAAARGKAPPILTKNKKQSRDTALLVKNTRTKKQAAGPAPAKTMARKPDSAATAGIKKQAIDTAAIAKVQHVPLAASAESRKVIEKKDSTVTAKNTTQQKKDTVRNTSNGRVTSTKGRPLFGRTSKERKDTIIIMSGAKADNNKLLVKNIPAKKDSVLLLKKEILQAPEEKRDALMNNKGVVVINKVPIKVDTLTDQLPAAKDSANSIVKIAAVEQEQLKKDTVMPAPLRRTRPLVTKAAELLTDTSYIAVFVDESKDKFDTIRISIPFNETAAFARPISPIKTTDSIFAPVTTAAQAGLTNKTDTVASDKILKNETTRFTPVAPAPVVPLKTDSTIRKKLVDSATAVSTAAAEAVRKDSSLKKQVLDSVPVTVSTLPVAAKKDSDVVKSDSSPATKSVTPPLVVNSDCKEVAPDSEIEKLRIKMLVVLSDEDRIALAKKLFRQKCLLSKQVRALSELFRNDEGKYKWLDAVYPYVSDSGNFAALGDLIKDEYFLNRFKAMLRH